MRHSRNALQPQLIRYNASVDADSPNHSLTLGVNIPLRKYFTLDYGSDEEASAALLEEKEALAIQQRLAQQLDEGDFGLDIFAVSLT